MKLNARRKSIVKKLRRNMTQAEARVWNRLRNKQLGLKFRRQQSIGKYIADFACYEKKIIIEIDGGQHSEEEGDKARDDFFKKQGYTVLRFWNNDVLRNTDGVLESIVKAIHPPHDPLPSKGGE
ncbi:MAG: endonuclease domain-containing protein [candidate division WOR-3 bacterium]|nr:endonuclease domain-containing protein [candidate division WOR-3 bacterium]